MRDSDAQCQVPDTGCQLGAGTNLPWRRTDSAYGAARVLLFILNGRTLFSHFTLRSVHYSHRLRLA